MSDDILLDEVEEVGRLVSLADVKNMLETAEKDREELSYEQKIALEHARRFARTDAKKAASMVKELCALFPEADPAFAYKVADLVPQHPDDVVSIYQKSGVELGEAEQTKVMDIVDKYYVA